MSVDHAAALSVSHANEDQTRCRLYVMRLRFLGADAWYDRQDWNVQYDPTGAHPQRMKRIGDVCRRSTPF